jgi:hypothetical protein
MVLRRPTRSKSAAAKTSPPNSARFVTKMEEYAEGGGVQESSLVRMEAVTMMRPLKS